LQDSKNYSGFIQGTVSPRNEDERETDSLPALDKSLSIAKSIRKRTCIEDEIAAVQPSYQNHQSVWHDPATSELVEAVSTLGPEHDEASKLGSLAGLTEEFDECETRERLPTVPTGRRKRGNVSVVECNTNNIYHRNRL